MPGPPVLVTRRIPAAGLAKLEPWATVELWAGSEPPTPEQLRERLVSCEGLLCLLTDRIDRQLLRAAPRLRVVSTMSVGFDHIDLAACLERGIALGYTPGALTQATADFTFALILAVGRRLQEGAAMARDGAWTTWDPLGLLGLELSGATLGIFGLGRIGEAVARRARGFGAGLIYCDRAPNLGLERELGVERVEFPELLARSDVLTLHPQLSAETLGIIDADALRRMKSQAILINTARGRLVVTDALVQALEQGWIAGAGLDVTDPEPLPADHPLYRFPSCLITPHIASATVVARQRMAEMAADNLLAGLRGEPLPYPIPAPGP
jgi:lactate dehydrogenase-like 2-hydroxyacid dehydrogenase